MEQTLHNRETCDCDCSYVNECNPKSFACRAASGRRYLLTTAVMIFFISFLYFYFAHIQIARGAVVASAPECAAIGGKIMEDGGSAVDVAIAAAICNGVVLQNTNGLGGGLSMMIHTHREGDAQFLEARETAPRKSKKNMLTNSPIVSGPLVVGVPGQLRGLAAAHKRYGFLKWRTLISPSIFLCEEGINVSKSLAEDLRRYDLTIKKNEMLRTTFINPRHGTTYKEGEILKLPLYAKTLRVIAQEGPEALYTGSLSKQFVKDINGIIDLEDLAHYSPKWEEPVTATLFNGETLFSSPPPQSGILLTFIFNVLRGFITKNPMLSRNWIRIIETFKYAFGSRPSLGDNPFLIQKVVENLTSHSYARYIRRHILDNMTYQSPYQYASSQLDVQEEPYSAYVCVVVWKEDAVVLASNLHHPFGAGYATPNTGIILNGVMLSFSKTCYKSPYSLPNSRANFIERGRRPLTPITPSIMVDYRTSTKLLIGAAGGRKAPSIVTLILLRALWFNISLEDAVKAPRMHHQVFPMTLMVEESFPAYNQELLTELQKVGHQLEFISSDTFGAAFVLRSNRDGIEAICDPRVSCGVYYSYK